jgi:hypothetical protein
MFAVFRILSQAFLTVELVVSLSLLTCVQVVTYSVTLAPRYEWTRPQRGTAKLRVDKAFPAQRLGPSARAWLVTERGIGNLSLEEFANEQQCMARALGQTYNAMPGVNVSPCYLVFAVRGYAIEEVAAGGTHTLSHATCAYHATRWLRAHYGA